VITLKAVGQVTLDTFSWILGVRSGKWATARNNFIKGKKCAACGASKNLVVHHKVPVQVDPTKELDDDNFIVLCSKPSNCHFVFGHLHSYVSWNPDVVKDCEAHFNKVRKRPCLSKE
jgi:hypothetical protein